MIGLICFIPTEIQKDYFNDEIEKNIPKEMKDYLDKQMEEKKLKEAEEKVANAKQAEVWKRDMKMYSEEKDNEGKTYRKDAVVNAMASGSGWVSFSINTKDGKKTMESFYKIVKGSDKKNYIVLG